MKSLFDPTWFLIATTTPEEILANIRSQVQRMRGQPDPPIMAYIGAEWPRHIPITGPMAEQWIRMNSVAVGSVAQPTVGSRETLQVAGHQLTGRETYAEAVRSCVSDFTIPTYALDDGDKRKKNKLARKSRQGSKGSANSRGRRWWESR